MSKEAAHENKQKKTSNVVLICLAVFALLFIVSMIVTFWVKGSVPDTLIQYVLGAGGLEAFLLAGIKISKVIKGDKKEEEPAEEYTNDFIEMEDEGFEIDNERYY